MNASTVAVTSERRVARSPDVLVPLIRKALADAKEAAEEAARPHFEIVGLLLAEARPQMSSSEYLSWAFRHFKMRETQANELLRVGKTLENNPGAAGEYSSHRDYQRRHLGHSRPSSVHPQPWHNPIKETLNKVDIATLNIRQDELKRAEARRAKRELMLQLIDIGYKALATKLHPDKGGSREAMARLNEVRKDLKDFANR